MRVGIPVDAYPASRTRNSQPHGIGRVVALEHLIAWNNLGRNIVFAGNEEDFFGPGGLQNLLDLIELRRFREVSDIAGVQHEFGSGR